MYEWREEGERVCVRKGREGGCDEWREEREKGECVFEERKRRKISMSVEGIGRSGE